MKGISGLFRNISLAGMIRHEYDAMNAADMRDRTNFVFRFSKQLKWLSDVFQLGILVINQVCEENTTILNNALKFILFLDYFRLPHLAA